MARENNSSVVRVHKTADFTIMSNHHLRNIELSLKAVGLMSKLLGLPDDWCYSIAGLVKICKEGETAVRAALHELIDEKYVYVEKLPPNYSQRKQATSEMAERPLLCRMSSKMSSTARHITTGLREKNDLNFPNSVWKIIR